MHNFYSLIQVFNTLLVAGNTVVRSLVAEEYVCGFSSAETDSGWKFYLNIIGLLEAEEGNKTTSCDCKLLSRSGKTAKISCEVKLCIQFTLGRVPKKFRPPSG